MLALAAVGLKTPPRIGVDDVVAPLRQRLLLYSQLCLALGARRLLHKNRAHSGSATAWRWTASDDFASFGARLMAILPCSKAWTGRRSFVRRRR